MNAMQPPQSAPEIKAGLETTEKGGVRQSIRNCLTVFQRDPLLSGAIAYNILTDRKDIIKPIGFHRESTALNDTDMKYLLLYLEETYGLTNEKKIDNAIGIVANENKYHPIRDYLSSLVWDGTERIRFCLRHFLGADADDYTYEALKLFLLGAISRAFQPGCKFEIMLCLVGGQGAGKSTFFRLLAIRDEWFSDDLRKLDDDNVYRKLQGHWIIEMSEMMATANAKSIEEIKSFLSRQKEVYKIPYETHPADRPRQCVFGGTSNALDFLPLDRSGNRRFIPVMVYPEQAEVHILEDEAASRAYIEQMWAEAMEIYRSGRFKLAFSPAMQRYLKEHQRDFMPEDTKAGMIQAYLDKYTGSMVCSKPVYTGAIASQKKDYRFKIGTIGEKKPEDWIVVEGQHEPLIDRMSFDIVQNKLKSRQRPGQTNEISLFAGLLKCGECGKSLTIRYTNAKHPQRIYSCKTYNAFGKNHCTQHRIDYDTLYSHVLRKIRECARAALMDGEAVADRLTNTCEAEQREQREAMERSLTRDEERIEVLDKMVMRLYEDMIAGRISEQNFNTMLERTQTEQTELKTKVSEGRKRLSDEVQLANDAKQWVEAIQEYANITELDAATLNRLIKEIVVHERIDENKTRHISIEIHFNLKPIPEVEQVTA